MKISARPIAAALALALILCVGIWIIEVQAKFLRKTFDEVILDNVMIQDGAIWRFKLERGLDFQDLKAQALDQIETTKTKLMGAGVLTVNNRMMGAPLIGFWSYPEGNFGI